MITQREKTYVSISASLFVFLGYLLEGLRSFDIAYENVGIVALTPYATVAFVTLGTWYYHHKEDFKDHFRLLMSCVGLPGFLVGLQGISKIAVF